MGKWTAEDAVRSLDQIALDLTFEEGWELAADECRGIIGFIAAQQRVVEAAKACDAHWMRGSNTMCHGGLRENLREALLPFTDTPEHQTFHQVNAKMNQLGIPKEERFTDTPCEECGGSEVVDSIGSGEHLQTIYCSTCTPDTEEVNDAD